MQLCCFFYTPLAVSVLVLVKIKFIIGVGLDGGVPTVIR